MLVYETYDTKHDMRLSDVLTDNKVAKASIIRKWSPYDRDAHGS
jgi:hypothetical protein